MARGDEGWDGDKMEREAGGGRGRILGKIGRERGEISVCDTCADPRREEGDKGWEGRQGVGEGRGLPHVHPSLIRIKYIGSILV